MRSNFQKRKPLTKRGNILCAGRNRWVATRCLWFAIGIFFSLNNTQAATEADGNNYSVEVWGTEQGLPDSTVTGIAQTSDGYLWIGTLHGGLARFDGVRFVTFQPGNMPELRSIEVHQLASDSCGTLWIGTAEGALVSLHDGRFQFERQNPNTPDSWFQDVVACSSNQVTLSSMGGWLFQSRGRDGIRQWDTLKLPDTAPGAMFVEDRDGVIWYRTRNLKLGRWKAGVATELAQIPGLKNYQINVLTKDLAGNVWIGTPADLAEWDGKQFVNEMPTNGEASSPIQELAFAPDGGMWVRTPGQLRQCKGRRWILEADAWPVKAGAHSGDGHLYADADGGAWLVNYGPGLWRVDADGRTTKIGAGQGLPNDEIQCWFQDREGNIWLGLTDGGLARIKKATFHLVWPANAIAEGAARSVCEDAQGAMWFGTTGNRLLRWQNGQFTAYDPPGYGQDLTVCPAANGQLWAGSVHDGAFIFENGKFSRPFPSLAIDTVVRALFRAQDGGLWIGNEFGLFLWRNHQLKHFSTRDGFKPAYVVAITQDHTGSLWFGTAVGELRQYRDGKFTTYRPADTQRLENPPPPTNSVIGPTSQGRGTLSGGERFWALHADDEGNIWIGSLGGGLLRFRDGKFTRYSPAVGLPSENINQILEDGHGQLWLGTPNGIACVSKEELNQFASGKISVVRCITYGRSDGLPTLDCPGGIQPDCWRARDGKLWFTTVQGTVWIQPNQAPFNSLPPPVVIEGLWVDGKRLDAGRSESPKNQAAPARFIEPVARAPSHAVISPGRHYFEFKFTGLSFTSPEKVRFQWRLEPLETAWVNGGNNRTVSYSFIPPGEYQFQVKACNNDGVWNEQPAELRLTVRPYFWQTWWFRVMIIAALATGLIGLHRLKVSRMRSLERLRLRIARDLHDEVGANLGSISLLAQVMQHKPAVEDAHRIRSIAVQTVETLRDIVWFIDPAYERLSDLVTRMRETAKIMLQDIPFEFTQEGDFAGQHLPLDFRRNALPIFKEALHNITKHARASRVTFTVRCRANHFEVIIRDDGIGFNPEIRSSGNGLKNFKRRAQEMRGEIKIESRPGHGCTLTLTARITRTRGWLKLNQVLKLH